MVAVHFANLLANLFRPRLFANLRRNMYAKIVVNSLFQEKSAALINGTRHFFSCYGRLIAENRKLYCLYPAYVWKINSISV
jgi:hypothetical protein